MAWIFVVALVLAGCGSPGAGPSDAGPEACAPGELARDDGTCQPAGVPPDMPCPPGELPLDGGACQKAGVPASACAVGFMPDGKDGCEPILPPDPCPPGQMAVPGDTSCHEVAPCGSGTWGNIPVEANTQFVDEAYAGGNSDGTQAHPWTTIQQGIDAAAKGAIVAVAAGSYPEDLLILGKPVRLWGRCPSMVEVTGAGVELAAIRVFYKAAGGTEIHGVAVTGAKLGIIMSGASGVVIEQVSVHDTGDYGLDIEDAYGPTSVALKGSLLEQNRGEGIYITGADMAIEASVVRSILPDAQGNFGYGIDIEDSTITKSRANVTIHDCLVEKNHDVGVVVFGSDVIIEASVIRATLVDAQAHTGGGISIEEDFDTKARANATIRGCLVEQNQHLGVFVLGSDAMIEDTVIRSSLANAQGALGVGIGVRDKSNTKARANVIVHACLVESNESAGVSVWGSDATIEATVVRSNLANGQGSRGNGLVIGDSYDTKARANVTVRACLVEKNQGLGVGVLGSDATIETSVVRSTLPDAEGQTGEGIAIMNNPMTTARAKGIVTACLVEQNREVGVYVSSSDATIEDTTVRDTAARSDDTYGDGIFVEQGIVEIRNAEVTDNARAGVSNFGGQVVVTGGVITCNAFDLDGETDDDIPFSFDGSTGWQCSARPPAECSALDDCHVESSGLAAPPPPPAADPPKP